MGFEIDRIIRDAERKLGVTGLKDMLRGRFLFDLPPIGILKVPKSLDSAAIAAFFAAHARNWITGSIIGKS